MQLVKPSLGICVDRLTILLLKIKYGEEKKKDVSCFQFEVEEIKKYIVDHFKTTKYNEVACIQNDLQHVNALLWKLEDDIREFMHKETLALDDKERVQEIAFLIPVLNDQRAGFVSQLNKIVDPKDESEDKIYAS